MDLRLIPVLALLYLLSFLDRKFSPCTPFGPSRDVRSHSMWYTPHVALVFRTDTQAGGNIGNAKIEGLQEDLGLHDYEYNWCLTAFFFTYAAFEVPSNLLLKRLRPSRWLPAIMVAWGTVMTLMGLVRSYRGLLAARLFLGVAEAGLYPGVAVSWFISASVSCFLCPCSLRIIYGDRGERKTCSRLVFVLHASIASGWLTDPGS